MIGDVHADRTYEMGDAMTVIASFASRALTTMMLQLNGEDCDGLETATVSVTKIDALHPTGWLPRFVPATFGE